MIMIIAKTQQLKLSSKMYVRNIVETFSFNGKDAYRIVSQEVKEKDFRNTK